MNIKWIYSDGGRKAAGFKGNAGDCLCRAVSIATQKPYKEVYDIINQFSKMERNGKRKATKSSANSGVYMPTAKRVMEHLGWTWVPLMGVGTGCKVHLKSDELPSGRIICRISKHYAAVVDGVIHDNHDCSRGGTRCVYGYWHQPKKDLFSS